MNLILDASVTLAWHLTRASPNEALLAQEALHWTMIHGALVPYLWYPEVANALVISERQGVSSPKDSSGFLADLDSLPISFDPSLPRSIQSKVLALARTYQLTAYDATYLELALRTSAQLATFDRKLAEAYRKASGPVFGDKAPSPEN